MTAHSSLLGTKDSADAVGRVLYVQYSNPAAYPPIEHSAQLLADAGFEVLLLGTDLLGDSMTVEPHPRVQVRLRPWRSGGPAQKVHYASFMAWSVATAFRFRPDWIYVSDPLAAPFGVALGSVTGARVVYHEHDSPDDRTSSTSAFMRIVLAGRLRLARRASTCILPNARRAEAFSAITGRQDPLTVWNCPMRREVSSVDRQPGEELRVFYHGTIVPARLPVTVVQALARVPNASLTFAGYETAGHRGYVDALLSAASQAGVSDRVHYLGTLTRQKSMQACATCDVGVSLMPIRAHDVNEDGMVGASNKVFDYMAGGLAVLVTDRYDWRSAFVETGFGIACDPGSVNSVAAALQTWASDPKLTAEMGRRGRQRIFESWNYETAFAPVLSRMLDRKAV